VAVSAAIPTSARALPAMVEKGEATTARGELLHEVPTDQFLP
jgi:hypothetical protein